MKTNRYLYMTVSSIFCIMVTLFTSCMQEELYGGGTIDKGDYSSITLQVTTPDPTVCEPMTKATASDFDQLKDLNVVIAEAGDDNATILKVLYLTFDENGTINLPVDEGVYSTQNSGTSGFGLHFTSDWLNRNGVSLQEGVTPQLFLVGNWGSQITGVSTVSDLRNLRATSNNGVIQTPNVMFGETKSMDPTTSTDHPTEENAPDGKGCLVYTMELKRTAAMITLQMNGEGLDQGIVIIPTKVSLHNVPNACTIGYGNKVTANPSDPTDINVASGAVNGNGDFKDGSLFAEGFKLVGKSTTSSDPTYKTTIGNHYTSDYTDKTILPLFLYENLHGNGFGASENDEKYKRPAKATNNIPTDTEIASCSYIQVEANYIQYGGSMNVIKKGTASWRFFLGENVTDNFEITRNTYYKIDLILSGKAVDEYSWRVSKNLVENPAIVGETEMVVGGGGEIFGIEFTDPAATQNMKIVGANANFVYVYATPNNDKNLNWYSVAEAGNGAYKHHLVANQIWFYVSPFLPDDGSSTTERSATVSFTEPRGTLLAEIKFTQYKPITVSVSANDVSGTDMQGVKEYIEANFNYSFSNTEPFTFYVDRVDRDPMPWGFSNVTLKNHHTGFENVYHLIQPLKDCGVNCNTHVEYAKNYLPTGKGWNAKNNTSIDYTKGSCMMHAAMENYFQQYDPKPNADVTPEMLYNMTNLPERPTTGMNCYYWCVPSIVGWQLLERLEQKNSIFDSNHPISKWTSYWTSNANTSGSDKSYVYQFDMGYEKIPAGESYPSNLCLPRSTALKYRLINIDPKYIKSPVTDNEPSPLQ